MKLLFDKHGVEIKNNYVSASIIEAIKNEVSSSKEHSGLSIRNADNKFNTINTLVHSDEFISLANNLLGSSPNIVRVILFDKTPDNNWLVTWHQDKTIAVSNKEDIKGWGPWSFKDQVHHVQPPINVLNQMVTFRLHLDDANKDNGCLKVIPKSHELGILSQQEATKVTGSRKPYVCEVLAGDLLIMKPHLLHSSSKSIEPNHRRVVHVEYSNYKLPEKLSWA